MQQDRWHCPPADQSSWIAAQEGATASEADACRQRVAAHLTELAEQVALPITRRGEASGRNWLEPYVTRLWNCCHYHWPRLSEKGPIRFDRLVALLQDGLPGDRGPSANLLRDVTLAQALELHEAKAAEMFEHEFMPVVRSTTQRVGGPSAVDAVDNFAAELILPRDGRPPRIAQYQGRTSLAGWLRAVVTNFWISRTRQRQAINLPLLPEAAVRDPDAAARVDGRSCEEMLRPLFTEATLVLETEERVLVKMLLLDGVGQNELARSLGVASGTLTRRRQRAVERVLDRIRELSATAAERRKLDHCLELVLMGGDASLKQRLGEVLAAGVRTASAERASVEPETNLAASPDSRTKRSRGH